MRLLEERTCDGGKRNDEDEEQETQMGEWREARAVFVSKMSDGREAS